jgi:hypothetical protein
MSHFNLMLHCGAEEVTRESDELWHVPSQLGNRHHPIAHIELINQVEQELSNQRLNIVQSRFGATKEGARFFGLLQVANDAQDYTTIIGLRASHDQSIAAGIVAGSGVFVCDNLCFSGEVKLGTKQTTNLMERLPELVYSAVNRTKSLIDQQSERFESYKKTQINKRIGDAAIVELIRRDAIAPSQAGKVIEEWDNPSHEEFAQDGFTPWRLHNAVTEVYKPTNGHTYMATLPKRSEMLTGFCDELSGVSW